MKKVLLCLAVAIQLSSYTMDSIFSSVSPFHFLIENQAISQKIELEKASHSKFPQNNQNEFKQEFKEWVIGQSDFSEKKKNLFKIIDKYFGTYKTEMKKHPQYSCAGFDIYTYEECKDTMCPDRIIVGHPIKIYGKWFNDKDSFYILTKEYKTRRYESESEIAYTCRAHDVEVSYNINNQTYSYGERRKKPRNLKKAFDILQKSFIDNSECPDCIE